MSFKDAVVKQRRDMAINSGEVVLRFAQGVDETAILRELAATKRDLRSIFSGHDLKFTGVRKGSIKFRFTLPHDAQVFDSLAVEGRIREFVKDLCSCEPFNQLTKREDVQLEFLCKAQVNGVAGGYIIIIIIDRFYIALFSALLSRLTALACDST